MGEKIRLSSLVLARMNFEFEVDIAFKVKDAIAPNTLEKLVNIKNGIDSNTKKTLASIFSLLVISYFIESGIHVVFPVWGANIEKLPYVLNLIDLAAAFSFLVLTINFINAQLYSGIIDAIITKLTNNQVFDPDIVRSSLDENWLVLKILRKDFSFYQKPLYTMGAKGIGFHRVLGFFLNSIFLAAILIPPIIISGNLITHYHYDFFAITTIVMSTLCLMTGLLLTIITSVGFECEYGEVAQNTASTTHPSSTPK